MLTLGRIEAIIDGVSPRKFPLSLIFVSNNKVRANTCFASTQCLDTGRLY